MKKILLFLHKRFFYFLAGFICGAFLIIILVRSSNLQDSVVINSYIPSPSNAYIAISYTDSGGGAAGWCYNYLSLVPKWHPKGFGNRIYTILADRCGSLLTTTWRDESTLVVKGRGMPFEIKNINHDGKVKIIYE